MNYLNLNLYLTKERRDARFEQLRTQHNVINITRYATFGFLWHDTDIPSVHYCVSFEIEV